MKPKRPKQPSLCNCGDRPEKHRHCLSCGDTYGIGLDGLCHRCAKLDRKEDEERNEV